MANLRSIDAPAPTSDAVATGARAALERLIASGVRYVLIAGEMNDSGMKTEHFPDVGCAMDGMIDLLAGHKKHYSGTGDEA